MERTAQDSEHGENISKDQTTTHKVGATTESTHVMLTSGGSIQATVELVDYDCYGYDSCDDANVQYNVTSEGGNMYPVHLIFPTSQASAYWITVENQVADVLHVTFA